MSSEGRGITKTQPGRSSLRASSTSSPVPHPAPTRGRSTSGERSKKRDGRALQHRVAQRAPRQTGTGRSWVSTCSRARTAPGGRPSSGTWWPEGLTGVRLAVSDDHRGLVEAIAAVLPGSSGHHDGLDPGAGPGAIHPWRAFDPAEDPDLPTDLARLLPERREAV